MGKTIQCLKANKEILEKLQGLPKAMDDRDLKKSFLPLSLIILYLFMCFPIFLIYMDQYSKDFIHSSPKESYI